MAPELTRIGQALGEGVVGESRQGRRPLFYGVIVKVKVWADREGVEELVERLRNLDGIDMVLGDLESIYYRVEQGIARSMDKDRAERVLKMLSDVEAELRDAKRSVFAKLADLGEIVEVSIY